jgi:hypothetical protein
LQDSKISGGGECVAAVRAQLDARKRLETIFGDLNAIKFRFFGRSVSALIALASAAAGF